MVLGVGLGYACIIGTQTVHGVSSTFSCEVKKKTEEKTIEARIIISHLLDS